MNEIEEEGSGNAWKIILSLVFFVVVVGLLGVYWFVPFRTLEFDSDFDNTNFTIQGEGGMQFYPKMRYPDVSISYKISDCSLQKTNDMERAFELISQKTILEFEPVASNEEISVTCDESVRFSGELFVAGEGGPSNITKTANFNVIQNGKVLLIRDSDCAEPNVAVHELLHALGFEHSTNPGNIMYNISNCNQEIGDDTIALIDELYATLSLADLSFEEISATVSGRYLDTNISVRNNGLKNSGDFKIAIYTDEDFVDEFDVDGLGIGYGTTLILGNVGISEINIDEIKFVINAEFAELDKKNNEKILKIKEKN